MKVLVTGGSGFIGRYVVEELFARGHDPFVLDTRHDRVIMVNEQMVPVHLGDIRDGIAVHEAMAHAEAFIHLAAVLGTQETIQEPRPAAETNVLGGLNILQSAAHYNVPGTYIGVGNHWMQNTYSITKTTVERFVQMFNQNRGTRINVVRAMNAYGPRQVAASPYGPAKVRKITPSFCCRALMGEPIEVYGDGNQTSDMVHVRDVAQALVLATEYADKGCVLETPIEVGPTWHNTVNEVAELINELAGNDAGIKHLPMRPGEEKQSMVIADNRTLKWIGMDPDKLTQLRPGMQETVEYFMEYLDE